MGTVLRPFGRKAHTFAMRDPKLDKPITILEGSIRSGKTFSFHPKLMAGLCTYKVDGLRAIIGVSKSTVKDNLLRDLFDIIGEGNYKYNAQTGDLRLFNSDWIVIGAKDDGSEKYLRGKTIGIAVVEEGVLIPESFFTQLTGRMSPKGNRLYVNTNPDNPFHYLKKDWIDNEALKDDIEVIHFDLDDNPNLTTATRERYKRSYSGVFYDRMIRGLWVVAEGAIYRDSWNDSLLYSDATRPIGLYGAGGWQDNAIYVDYGTVNPTCFLDVIDDGRVLWFDREYYWDSKARTKQGEIKQTAQKTDQEFANDLDTFVKASRVRDSQPRIVVDPSAASFKIELIKRGYWVVDADNAVLDGIRRMSSAMNLGLMRVHEDMVNFRREVVTYSWDDKKSKKGDEEPIKKNDHAMDPARYACNDVFKNEYRLSL